MIAGLQKQTLIAARTDLEVHAFLRLKTGQDTKQVFGLGISIPTFVLYVMYNNALRMGCGQEPVKPEEARGHRF